jgi:hypothetical protein
MTSILTKEDKEIIESSARIEPEYVTRSVRERSAELREQIKDDYTAGWVADRIARHERTIHDLIYRVKEEREQREVNDRFSIKFVLGVVAIGLIFIWSMSDTIYDLHEDVASYRHEVERLEELCPNINNR